MKRYLRFALPAALLMTVPAGAREEMLPLPVPAIPAEDVAPIALMADLPTGQVLYARDPRRRFVPASITKVMTAFVAFELIKEGKLHPDQVFTMSPGAGQEWSRKGSTMFLEAGDRATVDQILHGITTVSANDGCIVLAEGAVGSVAKWVALMNSTARELGMADSHFGTPNGWMDEGRTYVTAQDLATLARALLTRHPDLYRRYFGHHSMVFKGITQNNHDPITGVVPGADGIKTGFTRQAGYGFLGTATRHGQRLVMVLAGVDTGQARRQAARQFMEWGFQAFDKHPLFPAGSILGSARVQGGADVKVGLKSSTPVYYLTPAGKKTDVSLSLRYKGPLQAPIAAGAPVAELEINVKGQGIYRVPLVATKGVPSANFWQRVRNGLYGLVA